MKNYVDKADIEARIKDVSYLVMPDGRTTICTILMVNGFTVNGFSACRDIKRFDAALGRKCAYENAFLDLWQLEGYLLAERLSAAGKPTVKEMVDRFLSWKLPKDFGPDAGISFKPSVTPDSLFWPTGTNLLHAGQAQEMIEFITGSTSQ